MSGQPMMKSPRGRGRAAQRSRPGSRGGRNGSQKGERCRREDSDAENRCGFDSLSGPTSFHAEGGSVSQRGQGRGLNQQHFRRGSGGKQRGNRGGRRGGSQTPDFGRGSSLSLTSENLSEMGSQSSLVSERGKCNERGRGNPRFSNGKVVHEIDILETANIPSLMDVKFCDDVEVKEGWVPEFPTEKIGKKRGGFCRGRETRHTKSIRGTFSRGMKTTCAIRTDTDCEYFERKNDDKEAMEPIDPSANSSLKNDKIPGRCYYNKTFLLSNLDDTNTDADKSLDPLTRLIRKADEKSISQHSLAENKEKPYDVAIDSVEELAENEKLPSKVSSSSDVRDAFRTLLTKFNGRARIDELLKHKALFPDSFFNPVWLKQQRNNFLVFNNNQTFQFVSVCCPKAKLCFFFNGPSGCTNETCQYFHVCSGFVSKTCKPHIHKCNRSHNFLEKENNAALVSKLGLDEFKNKEIAKIVRYSVPEVCKDYNQGVPHDEDSCLNLHVCDQYPCSQRSTCQLEHRCLSSQHNQWVLNCFHIRHFKEHILERLVLGRNSQVNISESFHGETASSPNQSHPIELKDTASKAKGSPVDCSRVARAVPEERPKVQHKAVPVTAALSVNSTTSRFEVEASDAHLNNTGAISEAVTCDKKEIPPIRDGQYLCEEHVWSTCSENQCPHYHGYRRVPYQWQIQLHNPLWHDLEDMVNDCVERNYCNRESTVSPRIDAQHMAVINLDTMTARLYVCGQDAFVTRVRRLSTRSYCQGQGNLSRLTAWCWYWFDNGNIWEPYEPDRTQYSLEKKYLHGQKEYNFEHGRFHYTLNFSQMRQLNLETGKERRVMRRPMFVSHQEVQDKCIIFHPYLVEQIPEEKYTVPSHWTPLDLVQPFELVKLLTRSNMFVKVENSFHSTLDEGRYKISSIFQVQNPSMWDKHCSHKRSMEHTAEREGLSCGVDERMLYHGTDSEEVVRGICVNGFDHRVCGKNGTVYGKGAYFAVKSSYSNSYTGGKQKRYMFRARVLVGKYTTGTSELTRPPCRKGHVLYDSCVDRVHDPSIFVLFDQNQAYPEFLIEYEDRLAPVNVFSQPSIPRFKPAPAPAPAPARSNASHTRPTYPINPRPTSPRQPPPTQPTKDSKCVVM